MQPGTMCYIESDDRKLMIRRNKRPKDFHYGKYVPPGGKVREGERPDRGMLREVLEETGYILRSYTRVGEVLFRNDKRTFSKGGKQPDWKVYVYWSSDYSGKQKKEIDEGTLEWVTNGSLRELPVWPGDLRILDWLEGEEYFIGELFYDKRTLIDTKVAWRGRREVVMRPDYSGIDLAAHGV